MYSLAHAVYLESEQGEDCRLSSEGLLLGNQLVYDACARELKTMAARGLVEILEEYAQFRDGRMLIKRLVFRRLG